MISYPLMEPGYLPFYELLLDVNEFNSLPNLLKGKKSKGASGEVFKFEYPPKSHKYIACKRLFSKKFDIDVTTEKLFFREVFITNKVRHPCTVELIAFDFRNIKDLMISTRFYELGSLDKLLMNKQYREWGNMETVENPDQTDSNEYVMKVENGTIYTILMYGIARGVRYLHSLKIFHRDIKPENIIIDKNYIPHIADYGLSKENISDDIKQSGIFGTFHYMAPEIADGDLAHNYSFPADIFALALLFYCLTEGKYYMPNIDLAKKRKKKEMRAAILNLFMNGEMPEFQITPPNLRKLIEQMWSVLPYQRPKIDEVCEILVNSEYWFPNTDGNAFFAFKKDLDDFEAKQFPLVVNEIDPIVNDVNDLGHNVRDKFIIDNKLTNNQGASDPNYKPYQNLLHLSELSNTDAKCSLGVTFYTGFKGIPKDYLLSLKYLNEAKNQDSDQADLILKGILTEIKRIELESLNQNSSRFADTKEISVDDTIFDNLKSMQAQLLMGMVKEASNQTVEAIKLYTNSAKQGSMAAKGRLGCLLLKNNLMLDKAEILLTQASGWGRDDSKDTLIDEDERKIALFHLGLLKLRDEDALDTAIQIFESLLNDDHPDSAICIAIAYHLKDEYLKARDYYEMAYTKFSNESAKPYYMYFKNLLLE